jgi:hypothetical protein
MEYKIPNATSNPVAQFHPAGAVMVQMVPLVMAEVGIARPSEVQEIVEPFFADIALHHARKQARQGVNGRQETQRCSNKK